MKYGNNYSYDNFELQKERIKKIEESVKRKPCHSDLKETIRLLKDFGIKMTIEQIPDCRSVCELQRWRVGIIKNAI